MGESGESGCDRGDENEISSRLTDNVRDGVGDGDTARLLGCTGIVGRTKSAGGEKRDRDVCRLSEEEFPSSGVFVRRSMDVEATGTIFWHNKISFYHHRNSIEHIPHLPAHLAYYHQCQQSQLAFVVSAMSTVT